MVSISNVTVVIIVQAIILLVLLAVFLAFLLRAKNKEYKSLVRTIKSYKEISPISSVSYYFTAAIKLTENRFSQTFTSEDLKGEVFGEPDWLFLRKNFLEIEKELLVKDDKIESFWIDIGDKVKSVLKDSHLVKRIKIREVKDDDEEDELKEMKQLLKSQYDDFDGLYLELEGKKTEAEVKELKRKLSGIIRSHTELSHCIYMLEDENLFLRNQIKGLVDDNK